MPDAQSKKYPHVEQVAGWTIAIIFIGLRLIGFFKENEIGNQDSLGYLSVAEMIRTFDLQALMDLNASTLPLYSFAIALFSFATGDFESAGSLVSLTSSVATAIAVYLFAKRFVSSWAGLIAVAIMAVNPYLIRFSYSIITEPMYAAIFSWTLYYFVIQLRDCGTRSALILGAIAGLAFYLRFESILLFASLPVLQVVYLWWTRMPVANWRIAKAGIVYLCTFVILITPQVWRVSDEMNSFSLNGRTAWQTILKTKDGKTYQQKIFGLDYDPATTNIHYLMQHPEQLQKLVQTESHSERIMSYVSKIALSLEKLHADQVARLVGLPVFAFAVIGFLGLLKSAHAAESMVVVAFLGLGLAAPLVAGVELDHIALLAPPVAMLAGMGLYDSLMSLRSVVPQHAFLSFLISASLLAATVSPYTLDMIRLYRKPDNTNSWYDWADIEGPVNAIRSNMTPGEKPGIMESHSYVAYYSRGSGSTAPWTDLAGLRYYMKANEITYFFYDKYLSGHPFAAEVDSPEWNEAFSVLYEGKDQSGSLQKVYILRQ